jgi:hypothetical protein
LVSVVVYVMFSLFSVFDVVTDAVGVRRTDDSHAVTQVGAMDADAIHATIIYHSRPHNIS